MNPPAQNAWAKTAPPPTPVAPVVPSSPTPPGNYRPFYIGLGVFVVLAVGVVAGVNRWRTAKPRLVPPSRPVAPAQNGFPLLKSAAQKTTGANAVSDAISSRRRTRTVPLVEKRPLLKANAPALAEARAALLLPYYEQNPAVSMQSVFPHYKKFRELARVFALSGNVAWDDKKPQLAVSEWTNIITIGRKLPHQTPLIGRLVGIACESIGRRPIWKHLDALDEPTALLCLNRLNALQAERLPLAVTYREEKYTMERMAMEVYDHPVQAANNASGESDGSGGGGIYRSYTSIIPRSVVIKAIDDYIDKNIAQTNLPYPQSKTPVPEPTELLARTLAPTFSGVRLRYEANETGDALLRTALALRVYFLRHQKYPATLADLVTEKLLPTVPDDPFALPGEPLRYRVAPPGEYLIYSEVPGGKYLLYSIGPDSVSNAGRGTTSKTTKGEVTRYASEDSKGDMTVGWYAY